MLFTIAPTAIALLATAATSVHPHPSAKLPLVVIDFDTKPGGLWQGPRAAALLAQKLRYLGWPTITPSDPGPAVSSFLPQVAGLVKGQVRAARGDDVDGAITVALSLERASAPPLSFESTDALKNLDRLVDQLAIAMTLALGQDVAPEVSSLLEVLSQPTTTHRYLGLAAMRVLDGDFAQARVMYSRARSVPGSHALPEVVEGRRRVEAALSSSPRRRARPHSATDPDLVNAALERAKVAQRTRDFRAAAAAFESYFIYTDDRAQRWAFVLPIPSEAAFVLRSPRRFLVVRDAQRDRAFAVDAKYGTHMRLPRPVSGLVAISKGQYLTLRDRTVTRLNERLTPRWTRKIPALMVGDEHPSVVVTSGVLGVIERHRVTWLDLGLGTLGQVALGVSPIGSGLLGVLVKSASPSERKPEGTIVSLLRPGKRTPAWSTEVQDPRAVCMTRERVVILGSAGLIVLDALDGKHRSPPLPTPTSARFLGGEARFVVLGVDEDQVAVYDVLKTPPQLTARIQGPSRPIAAVGAANAVAVLFESGDLIWFSADGRFLDRALVPGTVHSLFPGSPLSPGVVAWTSLGLFAFSEVLGDPDQTRDVDGLLALAQALADEGDLGGALTYATEVAATGRGRIADAEQLRAELYDRAREKMPGATAASRAARARAKQASDPTQPLGPFELAR